MRPIVRLALPMLLTACSTVLGIDGEYDDARRTDAGSGASGGASAAGGTGAAGGAGGSAGAGAGGVGNSGGAGGAGSSGGAGGTGASGGSPPTGGTGAGGSTGGSGGNGTGEICGNGVDDDGDLKADCADSECATSKCAPPIPTGWVGPAVLWTGNATDTPPACPGGTTPVLTYAVDAPQADCTGVTCGCQVTGTCTATATVTHYGSPDCNSGKVVSSMVLTNTTCAAFSMTDAASGGVKAVFSTNDTQACAPTTTGTGDVPPVSLHQRLALCSNPVIAAGCTTGKCVTPSATHPKVCIHRPGNLSCPLTFPYRTEAGLSVNADSRGCSPCKCSSPNCYPTVKDHPNATCGASSSVYTSCNSAYNATALSRSLKLYIDPGTCGVTGGSPTGSVSVAGATTICCL